MAGAIGLRQNVAGKRILLARARGARESLPRLLRDDGAIVDDVAVYDTKPDESGIRRLADALAADAVDVITFTSGSAVRFFLQRAEIGGQAVVAVIGPATAEVALENGLQPEIRAASHTAEGLVAAIVGYYAAEGGIRRR
jgi:uroporphyrinogen III methyltransferase/synthase